MQFDKVHKFYLAARFIRRSEMEEKATEIMARDPNWQCVARWVFGGEEGLTRRQIAALDLNDVRDCDTLIIFTHKKGSKQPGGGRFVEMGYAMGLGKNIIVIGDYENVFTYESGVTVFPTWQDFLNAEMPVDG